MSRLHISNWTLDVFSRACRPGRSTVHLQYMCMYMYSTCRCTRDVEMTMQQQLMLTHAVCPFGSTLVGSTPRLLINGMTLLTSPLSTATESFSSFLLHSDSCQQRSTNVRRTEQHQTVCLCVEAWQNLKQKIKMYSICHWENSCSSK